MTEYLLYLYAESPVHTGAAGSLDVLDLPVQREASTGYPVIWGQSLKGALRQAAGDANWPKGDVLLVFGSDIEERAPDGGTTEGLLAVGDAQLVAMPVPTLRRTFAWVTSDIALSRLARKYRRLGPPPLAVPQPAPDRGLAAGAAWTDAEEEALGPCVVPLGPEPDAELAAWAARIAADALPPGEKAAAAFTVKLRTDLVAAGSDLMPTLLRECTERSVRVQLDASKKVKNGPFYSEYLPAETILAASLLLRGKADTPAVRDALRLLLGNELLQVGGDETIGKGLVRTQLLPAGGGA
ncbi:MAG TPA: type III-B CRISPR module RAMP protein Cmr4 [Streptosporangiaceae bacterium]|nr:type III-B CRISPR module RAMP protein Cmr4 [Streptosporangiaceae bacterium]